jgi:crotonobetainyl-CoA:carnitine CoA-transferase CaiB-like acyl-CoA transferase
MNTRKRDITLNSDLLDAVGLVRDLASTVVLLIEYPAPNERVRLGSSYEQYCGYNPTLVFCSVTEIST